MRADPDYRANQARAHATWRARHPDYWRRYRETHLACRDRNRAMQRERNARRNAGLLKTERLRDFTHDLGRHPPHVIGSGRPHFCLSECRGRMVADKLQRSLVRCSSA